MHMHTHIVALRTRVVWVHVYRSCSIARVLCIVDFGMLCRSFSIIQAINGGTRTSESPQGSGDKPNEMYGNRLADVMCELCWLQHRSGGKFSIENPLSSFLWKYPPVDQLSSICVDVDLDQCEYGLRPPHHRRAPCSDLRIKKPTRLRTSLHSLSALSVKCRGNHAHWRCLGSVRDDRAARAW